MVGEIAIKIDNLKFDRVIDLTRPYGVGYCRAEPAQDLTLMNGQETLHICGENDFPYLFINALKPLMEYEKTTRENIENELFSAKYVPKVILLGKNEFRAMDIMYRLRNNNNPFTEYKEFPVVRGKKNNEIELLGEDGESEDLPFK